MLDSDLAMLYQVETKRLNESVKRNIGRFPESFCFQMTKEEYNCLKSQFATSNNMYEMISSREGDVRAAGMLNPTLPINYTKDLV